MQRSASGSYVPSPMHSPLRDTGRINLLNCLDSFDPPSKASSGLPSPQNSGSPRRIDRRGMLSPLKHIDAPVNLYSGFIAPELLSPLRRFDSPSKPSSGLSTPQHSASPCKGGFRGSLSPVKRTRLSRGTSAGSMGRCEDAPPESLTLPSGRRKSEELSNSFIVEGMTLMRCVSDASCCTPSHASTGMPVLSPRSGTGGAKPLPKSDVEWLMSTLTAEELARFHRKYFVTDCKRRFHELGADCTGLLDFVHVQDALIEMFPTLKLELRVDGHHIPALDKSIPSLAATFDADADGYLDFDDFVGFIKFQQAWRAQFFSSGTRVPKLESENGANASVQSQSLLAKPVDLHPEIGIRARGINKSASLPKLGANHKTGQKASKCRKRPQNRAFKKCVLETTFDSIDENEYSCELRPSSSASCSTRCSSSQSSRSNVNLDSSRGSFYSSLMGFS